MASTLSNDGRPRCEWSLGPELLTAYHDLEWGTPCHDDRLLFEMLILEGAQAGLNWLVILKKRARYRLVFDGFDPRQVATYDERKAQELLADPGIVRNRLKVAAAIGNARAFLRVQEEFGSFDLYLWRFVDGRPVVNHWQALSELPSRTPLSDALSKDLLQRGFRFVGSTICYAFLQSVGLVNDHTVSCFRWRELAG
ncbi:MAG: DNA-3-methyladenine glycosylase I [Chloroflexota bacterium]